MEKGAAFRVQVQGICRWSYPAAPGAFQKEPEAGDLAALRAQLYAPERLRLRLFFLEYVMLPALRAQSDPDFTLHLLMGDQLPGDVRARVLALIADVPQIRPHFEPEGQPHAEVCRKIMLAGREKEARAVAEFRLDDDDAVATDFVEFTRQSFAKLRQVWRAGGKLALDCNAGLVLETGDSLTFRAVIARYWTPGLVLFLRPKLRQCVMDFAHAQLWKRIPTLTHPRRVMFIRGAHGDNDSNVSQRPHNDSFDDLPEGQIDALLAERFGISRADLQARWAEYRAGG